MPVNVDKVPPGHLRSVVTWLEMTALPAVSGTGCDPAPWSGLRVELVERMGLADYRALYRAVGEPWLWWERLAMSDRELAAGLAAPGLEIRRLRDGDGTVIGYSELDRADPDDVQIVYFGLVPEAIGQGLGRYLMAATLAAAWSGNRGRVWLHTCSEDHPGALGFYQQMGFRPYRSEARVITDPRATGALPPDVAPHVPVIR